MTDIDTSYARHLQMLQRQLEEVLPSLGYDGLLLFSGSPRYRFQDDQAAPFVANPHFKRWVPLPRQVDCALLVRPHQRPLLYHYDPVDFWHLPAGRPEGFWTRHFDIVEMHSREELERSLPHGGHLAFIGEEAALAERLGIEAVNPTPVLSALNWQRAVKSGYELECLREANRVAVAGHRAAEAAFRGGESEFGIHQAYLAATGARETELPYSSIVGLNTHAAVLHYQHLDRQPPARPLSFLLDAGVEVRGYASDITRTYSGESGLFGELIDALDAAQRNLLEQVRPGQGFTSLHLSMHRALARILRDFGLVDMSEEGQLESGITSTFFPHGLGHLLGLQVHDVGGLQADPAGTPAPPPLSHPFLRLTRSLETDMVVTVEPGLYFIEPLLARLAEAPHRGAVDWAKVDALRPYGGIRIEDNVRVTPAGCENFTRDAFQAG
ncbi:Xaa-Pro dipeptidase [Motiliproteus sp. SC1-56]|uniref:Xaa-Pro dipeptidase n=1 Tax=Motiliproteus sp. SC1-56 TaxID=2799565 RepID=UPI001F5C8B9C|nr:Xaa-Pro dipeptidase [Motiliproteus sp. SC1-56]